MITKLAIVRIHWLSDVEQRYALKGFSEPVLILLP